MEPIRWVADRCPNRRALGCGFCVRYKDHPGLCLCDHYMDECAVHPDALRESRMTRQRQAVRASEIWREREAREAEREPDNFNEAKQELIADAQELT